MENAQEIAEATLSRTVLVSDPSSTRFPNVMGMDILKHFDIHLVSACGAQERTNHMELPIQNLNEHFTPQKGRKWEFRLKNPRG